ncbi:MAG: hypothetical protein ACOYB2_17915 [Limnohabitans sp.]
MQGRLITDNGKLALSVRYSALLLKLAKGKYAVELASEKALLPTLEIIKTAVLAGALGTAIEIAASKLSDGFSR